MNDNKSTVVCSFISSGPYIMGCNEGHLVLLPTGIKCETICNSWVDGKCIRLIDGQCECKTTT